ncbi:MAG: fimbrillin family protein, partial [Prevotella sp.]|nr:fimbrillin family protein [Prevotella sp.]
MRTSKLFAIALAAFLVSCSSDDLVNDAVEKKVKETPIGFNVQKQNITRTANLETVKHYNFGVWAWKVGGKNSLADQEVMDNYLVGWSGTVDSKQKGYDPTNATTYATTAGTTANHTSPWFYEKLGTAEYTYTGTEGYYKKTDDDYMSKNANQYLRYWDLAYTNTNFYCYAPYNKNVTFAFDNTNHTGTMTFPATGAIRDGYQEPQNSAYASFDRSLSEFMYAGVQATNSSLADVTIPFKHMGAQLFIRFYEDIPGYKVEIIDLNGDNGTTKSGLSGDILGGIQA